MTAGVPSSTTRMICLGPHLHCRACIWCLEKFVEFVYTKHYTEIPIQAFMGWVFGMFTVADLQVYTPQDHVTRRGHVGRSSHHVTCQEKSGAGPLHSRLTLPIIILPIVTVHQHILFRCRLNSPGLARVLFLVHNTTNRVDKLVYAEFPRHSLVLLAGFATRRSRSYKANKPFLYPPEWRDLSSSAKTLHASWLTQYVTMTTSPL